MKKAAISINASRDAILDYITLENKICAPQDTYLTKER